MKCNSLINVFSITSLLLISLSACNFTEEIQQENKPLNIIYIMADTTPIRRLVRMDLK